MISKSNHLIGILFTVKMNQAMISTAISFNKQGTRLKNKDTQI